jgi:preprotein translocase subunit SecA
MFEALGVPEGEQIHHKMLSNAIEKAQQKIELNNYGIRENLLKYDEVNNEQRDVIYDERSKVLNGDNLRPLIISFIQEIIENYVDANVAEDSTAKDWDLSGLNDTLMTIIPLPKLKLTEEQYNTMTKNEFKQLLKEEAIKLYEQKEADFQNPEQVREIERVILLRVIDQKWMNHIDDMDLMRDGIGLQAYGQKDPLVEYKIQGFSMFEEMTTAIKEDTVRILYHIKVEQKVEREQVAQVTGTNRDDTVAQAPKKREVRKVYPNDPCPCGSGKKYKQCHGRNEYLKAMNPQNGDKPEN